MLDNFVLSAILLLSRAEIRADRPWVEEIARDIATTAAKPEAPVVFEGRAAREATALFLVAIAAHESGFQKAVDRCEKRGDSGRSRTLYQLIGDIHLKGHSRERVCSDRRLATRLALDVLANMRAHWPRATPQEIANAYTSGKAEVMTPQAQRICNMWQTRAKKLGLEGADCGTRRPIGKGALPSAPLERYTNEAVPVSSRCSGVVTAALASTLLVQGTAGCDRGDEAASGPREAPAAQSEKAVVKARRPTRKYYLGHTASRCEVYSVDDDVFSTARVTPCPMDLQPGERIRIAGKTCIRESSESAREQPVVCPDPLTNLEKQDRAAAASSASARPSASVP